MSDVTKDEYDVVVVGSGAGGAMAAYRLTAAGATVCMLEAGRNYDPSQDTPMHLTNMDAPLRGTGTKHKSFGYFDNAVGGWEVPGEPYSREEGSSFSWYRSRILGGRTNHWGRHVPRFGPADFRAHDRDGLSPNWPYSYEDLAPWYDKTEAIMGVSGSNTGLKEHPGTPAHILQPAVKGRVTDLFVAAGARALGLPAFERHNAILTRPLGDRLPCYYATPCNRGCSIGAAFQTTTSLIPLAAKTGKLTIITQAKVFQVLMGKAGKAKGVLFHDVKTGHQGRIKARAVVLAASALSSTQILFNSGENNPDGLANSSGELGKNLTDTVGAGVTGQFPALEGRPRYDEFGVSTDHYYMPWWGYEDQMAGRLNFPRGYHVEIGGGFGNGPDMGIGALAAINGGYGDKLREDLYRYYGSYIWLTGRGEMVANKHSYCQLDPELKDEFGVPVLKFSFKWSDYEYNQVAHMQKTFVDIINRMGGRVTSAVGDPKKAISGPGSIIHEAGTTRMGSDPDSSVVDPDGRCWDVDNLYVMDGGVMVTNPHKNLTLTLMALTYRNSEGLARRLLQGEL